MKRYKWTVLLLLVSACEGEDPLYPADPAPSVPLHCTSQDDPSPCEAGLVCLPVMANDPSGDRLYFNYTCAAPTAINRNPWSSGPVAPLMTCGDAGLSGPLCGNGEIVPCCALTFDGGCYCLGTPE